MQRKIGLLKKHVYLRDDPGIGVVAFSALTGLIYAMQPSLSDRVRQWAETGLDELVPDEIRYTLGAGWSIPLAEARFSDPHLLPSPLDWQTVPVPKWPILINWFITGRCPLECSYCYAEDLMRNDRTEPGEVELQRAAEAILALRPSVVVLTGGDPLFGPNFSRAVHLLGNRVGLIVDTSGYTLNDRHIKIIKEHGIAVRISLDSERAKVHNGQRPVHDKFPDLTTRIGSSLGAAARAIESCLAEEIPVTVQTVATKKNANELVALGEKLRRWGVHSWRIFKVAPSEARIENYRRLSGITFDDGRPVKGHLARGPFRHVFRNLARRYGGVKAPDFALQITENDSPNSVILVGPDGNFFTESNIEIKKVIIDEKNPKRPRLEAVHSRVNMTAHTNRYLNLTTKVFI